MLKRTIRFKAPWDADIGLFWGPRCSTCAMPTNYYDIEIGSYKNTKSLIRRKPSMDNHAVT
jgi:hypothetical protein